jgi:polysaccharide biosynthesis protein VpsQ
MIWAGAKPALTFMKWLAILFTLFIILVITLADVGILKHYVGFIYEVPWGDKAGHFILYGIFALLFNLALFRAYPDQGRMQITIRCGLILAVLIGLEEISQKYDTFRTFDLVDLTFSYLGVSFFSWVAVRLRK